MDNKPKPESTEGEKREGTTMLTLQKSYFIIGIIAIVLAIFGSNFVKPMVTAATQSLIISQNASTISALQETDKAFLTTIQALNVQQGKTAILLVEFEKRLDDWKSYTDNRISKLENNVK